jgi:hypothetical protein
MGRVLASRRENVMQKWQALLKKVKVQHIIAAIDEIRVNCIPVPRQRQARKWFIQTAGFHYPTKYILARAVEIATHRHFPPDARSGGRPTIDALKKILRRDSRFKIVRRRP